jgi:hypothetical protein
MPRELAGVVKVFLFNRIPQILYSIKLSVKRELFYLVGEKIGLRFSEQACLKCKNPAIAGFSCSWFR